MAKATSKVARFKLHKDKVQCTRCWSWCNGLGAQHQDVSACSCWSSISLSLEIQLRLTLSLVRKGHRGLSLQQGADATTVSNTWVRRRLSAQISQIWRSHGAKVCITMTLPEVSDSMLSIICCVCHAIHQCCLTSIVRIWAWILLVLSRHFWNFEQVWSMGHRGLIQVCPSPHDLCLCEQTTNKWSIATKPQRECSC